MILENEAENITTSIRKARKIRESPKTINKLLWNYSKKYRIHCTVQTLLSGGKKYILPSLYQKMLELALLTSEEPDTLKKIVDHYEKDVFNLKKFLDEE